jgi:hypothetical protein
MCGLSIFMSLLIVGDVRLERATVNLGEVRTGLPTEQRFEFTNTGAAPIEILGVRRDCGCLEPLVEQRHVAAGGKGTVVLRVRTLGQPEGQRTWNAWLQYRNGAETKESRLTVAATLRSDVSVQPALLALHVDKALTQEIIVTDRRSTPLRVIAARCALPALKATLLPHGEGMTRVLLEVAAADLEPGRHETTLELYTDDAAYSRLQVPVTLTRERRQTVTAIPALVHVRSAGVVSELVRLRSHEPLTPSAIEARDPAIKCTWATGPGTDVTVKVRVDTAHLASTTGHIVQVRFADAAHEPLTIPVVIDGK